jgi:hypothetical protein
MPCLRAWGLNAMTFCKGGEPSRIGYGLLAECGIKPDNSLNREVRSMEAGEHKSLRKAFVIGYWSFSIFYYRIEPGFK